MKSLKTATLVLSIISVALITWAHNAFDNSSKKEVQMTEFDSETFQPLGEPFAVNGNVKVFTDIHLSIEDGKYNDDITAKEEYYLVRFVNDEPKDSMMIVGPNFRLLTNGADCRAVIGVDTVKIDILHSLPKVLDLRYRDALPGCKTYRLSRHYALSDSSEITDFQINVALPDEKALHIENFISKVISNDISLYFNSSGDDNSQKLLVPVKEMQNSTVDQMMEYYYSIFRNLYDKEFKPEADYEGPAIGSWYSYQFYAYPVWQSQDSKLSTWKFYNFSYMGGAHGADTEYYLTFDNESGRILGAADFYTEEEFKQAVEKLTIQLNDYFSHSSTDELYLSADLNDEYYYNTHDQILYETIDNRIYPRPAFTPQGIVFTYQTSDKGSTADGVLHFTQPFDTNFILKR